MDGKSATYLVKKETHQTSSNDWIVNPKIPSSPLQLQPIEFGKVSAGVKQSSRFVYGRGRVGHLELYRRLVTVKSERSRITSAPSRTSEKALVVVVDQGKSSLL